MASVVLNGSVSGSCTITAPSAAGTTTLTLPVQTGTVMVNGPAFSAWQSSNQTLSNTTFTKITFTTEVFDTNNNFASSTFTPTVAGYYQINGRVGANVSNTGMIVSIYKNGTENSRGNESQPSTALAGVTVSSLVYLNGSTDYVEIYGYFVTGQTTDARQVCTYFNASMVRSA